MMACLYTEVGHIKYISIPEAGIAGNYYIQGIELQLRGGLIVCKWIVILALSLQAGLSPVAVEFAFDSTDAVNFGYLPKTSNLSTRTYSAWVYRDSLDTPNTAAMIFSQLTDLAGVGIYLGSNGTKLNVQIKCTGGQGFWETSSGLLNADSAWHHIVVTIDTPSVTPLAYIDGVLSTLTEVVVHSGTVQNEIGVPLVIGNEMTATIPFNLPFNGIIKDARIYNRIITQAEVTTLYNSGTPDESLVTDGLVFQAFAVRTENLADYADQTLTSSLTLRDNVFGAVGVPNGSPTGRSSP